MKLRDYQNECIDSIRMAIKKDRRALVVLPTGSGKTLIFSEIARRLSRGKRSICILVNKIKLVEQASRSLEAMHVKHTIYCAGLGKKELSRIVIATRDSIRDKVNDFDILCIDEVHRFSPEKYKTNVVIGFTATPFTTNKYIYGKDKFFKKPCFEKYLSDMTPEYLVPVVMKPQSKESHVDLSNVRKSGGDFTMSHLSQTLLDNKEKIDKQIDDAIKKSFSYKHIVVLAVSIEHAEYIYSQIDNAVIIHSKKKNNDIDLQEFESGKARILVSVLIASEGFDYPPADCIWFMRPTRSRVLYIQGVGRVLRKSKHKDHALMLDYGDIVENLGLVYTAHKFTEKKKKEETKICPNCESYNSLSQKECSVCGQKFLTTCPSCGKIKEYGEKCCEVKIDRYKNLSLNTQTSIVSVCDSILVNSGLKRYPYITVIYYCGVTKFCSEIISFSPKSSWVIERFRLLNHIKIHKNQSLKEMIKTIKNEYTPRKIKRVRNGIYWNREY